MPNLGFFNAVKNTLKKSLWSTSGAVFISLKQLNKELSAILKATDETGDSCF